VCVDLSFDGDNTYDMHTEKEKLSLCKQMSLSWHVLKTANKPVHLRITSYDDLNTTGIGLKNQGSKFIYIDVYNLYLLLILIIVYIHMIIIKTANKPVHLRITSYDDLNTTGIGLRNQGSKYMNSDHHHCHHNHRKYSYRRIVLGWKMSVHLEAP
jgi:hypothetical protein